MSAPEEVMLLAWIAGVPVAFPAESIESVIDIPLVTPAPRAANGVTGIAPLRSRIVTVIDPRAALGMDRDDYPMTRAVVGRVDGHDYAVLVEAVEDAIPLTTVPLPPGTKLAGSWRGVGSRIIDRPGEPVLVVDFARLLPATEHISAVA